jgi:microcompartment protein CcmL/EutN
MHQALGLIETVGLAAAYEAADTAVKTASVELIGYELSKGDGMVTVKIAGNVGAVQAGIRAAQLSASLVSKVFSVQVIPRPSRSLDAMVFTEETVLYTDEPEKSEEPEQAEVVEEQIALVEAVEDTQTQTEAGDDNEEPDGVREEAEAEGSSGESEAGPEKAESAEDATEQSEARAADSAKEEMQSTSVEAEMVEMLPELKESVITCNLCKDPACERKKGEPRRTCLHYFKN